MAKGQEQMDIGIVGAGRLGFGMGSIWAGNGNRVCFSYSRSSTKLAATVAAAGVNAFLGTPVEATRFGQVVLLAIHWPQVPQVISELQADLAGKPLLTCIMPWNSSHSGLSVGTDSSAAEEIARLAPDAHVVEALPLLADGLSAPAHLLGAEQATLFYCGDNTPAKETVALLLADLAMQPLDVGGLASARLLEPAMALLWSLAVGKGEGVDIALKLIRR